MFNNSLPVVSNIFENFRITDKERKYLDQIDSATLDKEYIAYKLKKNNWRKDFLKIIRSKDRTENVDLKVIASAWVYKLVKEPGTGVYLAGKSIKKIVRHLNCKRKGALIAVIGVNGSGKSTLTKKLLEAYEPVTKHLGLKQQGYYFGWKPYSFYAKIISARNLKKDNNFFESVNQGKKSGLFRELFFAYNFLEYYWRYLFEVRPALATNGLVVTDRYFYDLYGQYNLAPQSCLIKPLLKIYPRPDYLFVLDAPTEKIMNRAKEQNFSGMSKSPKRVVMDRDYLEKQKQRYYHLVDLLGGVLVNTQKEKNSNVTFMVEKSWKLVVR